MAWNQTNNSITQGGRGILIWIKCHPEEKLYSWTSKHDKEINAPFNTWFNCAKNIFFQKHIKTMRENIMYWSKTTLSYVIWISLNNISNSKNIYTFMDTYLTLSLNTLNFGQQEISTWDVNPYLFHFAKNDNFAAKNKHQQIYKQDKCKDFHHIPHESLQIPWTVIQNV